MWVNFRAPPCLDRRHFATPDLASPVARTQTDARTRTAARTQSGLDLVTSDCAGCVALGTQSLAPLLSCVCVCVFSVSLILLFPKEGVLWTKHTRNVRATVPESIVVTWCWQIKSWDEIMASQQTDCYGPVVTHCQNAEVWCSFRLTAEVKHKSASPCRDLLTSHQQCKYVNSAIPLGWRALKTPTAQTPGFCGHVTPLTLHYLWPRPPGVWLGGPGCKPGHSRGP